MKIGTKGAVFSDGDGTLHRSHLVVHWMREAVETKQLLPETLRDVDIAEDALDRREGTFHDFGRHVIDIQTKGRLEGMSAFHSEAIGRAVVERYGNHVNTFPRELCRAANDSGLDTFLISGSPMHVVRPFGDVHGIRDVLATTFHVEDGLFTGTIELDWIRDEGKKRAVHLLAEKYDLDLKQSVAIGDTEGDISMLTEVGYPICYNPSRGLRAEAEKRHWPIVAERKDSCYILVWSGWSQRYQLQETPKPIIPDELQTAFNARYHAAYPTP
ncbi:MAG: HAD family phosphatase [Patescibacteria group bacterium]|jgi:HAD superfamily hydrolase (TIGR01490 family)